MDDPRAPLDGVVDLAARITERDERLPLRAVRPWERVDRACGHQHAVVDSEARTLTCDDCNVALDPIAYLSMLASTHRRWRDEAERIGKARQGWQEHQVAVLRGRIARHRQHPELSAGRSGSWARGECRQCHNLRSVARGLGYILPWEQVAS